MSFWNTILKTRAEDWLVYRFDPSQVPGGVASQVIPAGAAYANLWLKSARVVNLRSGLKKFYGVVHACVTISPPNQGEAVEMNTVIAPKTLKSVDPRNLDRVIQINHRLLGPVAHSGNDVLIEIGLFSIEEADLVAPYLGLLEKISDIAGVGFLKTALPLAKPIMEGVNSILSGSGNSVLEIGLSRVFQPLETGCYLVMRVPKDTVDPGSFQLQEDWRVVGSDGKPVKDFPYLVFEVQATSEKFDWAKIAELRSQYDLIKNALIIGNAAEAKAGHAMFRRLALTSGELIKEDAKRLVKLVGDEIDLVLGESTVHSERKPLEVRKFENLELYPLPNE